MILKKFPTRNGMSPWAQIEFQCDECKCKYVRRNSTYLKMKENPLYTQDYCKKCWQALRNKQPEYRERMSNSLKAMRKDNPGLADKISETSKKRRINAGDKNAMKRPDVRKKMSKSRRERMKNDPDLRQKIAQNTANAWADGKFDEVRVGQCKWHEYEHSNGIVYKVQGSWELAFIKWLDGQGLSFTCHRGRLSYSRDGIAKGYYPDFWVDDWNCYVDIKAACFYDEAKFAAIRNSNPDVEIRIMFREDLNSLGIKV